MASTIKYQDLTIVPVQTRGGNSYANIKEYTEDATQSFVYGAPLVFDTSTTDVKLATDTAVSGIGLAIQPASTTSGTVLKVQMFSEDCIYRAPVLNAGATAANNISMIGKTYSWVARTDGKGYGIDTADTGSNDWFKVVALDPRSPSTSDPGYVLVTVLPAVFLDMNVA